MDEEEAVTASVTPSRKPRSDRIHDSNAARQRAYRQRQREKRARSWASVPGVARHFGFERNELAAMLCVDGLSSSYYGRIGSVMRRINESEREELEPVSVAELMAEVAEASPQQTLFEAAGYISPTQTMWQGEHGMERTYSLAWGSECEDCGWRVSAPTHAELRELSDAHACKQEA